MPPPAIRTSYWLRAAGRPPTQPHVEPTTCSEGVA